MYCEFDKKIDKLISNMTLREKIGQLNQITITPYVDDIEKLYEKVKNGEIGSIILASSATAGNDPQGHVKVELYNNLQKIAIEESRLGIPMIYGRDVIHGHRTVYPIPLAAAAAFNEELTEKCYRNVAKEAAADGIHWTFSPMLDMCHDPRWGRVIEGPGEDPFVGASIARAVVKGFQGDDLTDTDSLIACAKHYIGYGASEGGRDYHRTEISDYNLYNYYLPAFRAAVDVGVGTVMSSFNDISGQPVTSGKKYLTDILRGKLGFDGFVVSDWEAVVQLQKQGIAESRSDCAKLALNAGLDLDMCDRCYIDTLEELVINGEVAEETVDLAVKRILRVKFAKGLFENPYREQREVDRTEHIKLAREAAQESIILLKNDGVLPLKKDMSIAVAGPFLRERRALLGSWTLDGKAEETPNLFEAISNAVINGRIVNDVDNMSVYSNIDVLASEADVIVLALGESEKATGENRAIADISLNKDQRDLIVKAKATGKKVVGVFFCGRPIAMQSTADMLDAVVYAWHCGSETANAVCDILFGDVNPSGKTPITFPKKTGHIPLYYNVTSSGRPVNCYYGENPQNCYVDGGSEPYYPFGYGLSYTAFKYSTPKTDNESITLADLNNGKNFKVSVELKNTGNFEGKEVVQLYIHDKVASMMRPIRELKGFKKILLKQGESQIVDFDLGFSDLGFYTADGEYVVEKGEFEIFIGGNCLTENKILISVK
jgi:beta-glucosidase